MSRTTSLCLTTLALLSIGLAGCNEDAVLSDVIKQAGHVHLVPPSTLYAPGAFVAKRDYLPWEIFPSEVRLADLCLKKYSYGLYGEPPQPSATQGVSFSTFGSGRFSLDLPTIKKVVGIDLEGTGAKGVDVNFANATIYNYSEQDLRQIRKVTTPGCVDIINDYVKKKNAYQVRSVLQADVELVFLFEVSAKAEGRLQALKKFAELGLTVEPSGETYKASGRALVYGVDLVRLEHKI